MTIYALKPRFQALLRPFTAWLADAGITANAVTGMAAVLSLGIGAWLALAAGHRAVFLVLPVWLFARMALNAVDGMLARDFAQKSRLGAYLNEIGDVVSDAALYAPFALIAPFDPVWVGAVVVLAGLTEFAGVLGLMVGASRRYDGPMGKSDRAFVFGALGLWVGVGARSPAWFAWIMPVLAALLLLTIVNRVRGGLDETKGSAP